MLVAKIVFRILWNVCSKSAHAHVTGDSSPGKPSPRRASHGGERVSGGSEGPDAASHSACSGPPTSHPAAVSPKVLPAPPPGTAEGPPEGLAEPGSPLPWFFQFNVPYMNNTVSYWRFLSHSCCAVTVTIKISKEDSSLLTYFPLHRGCCMNVVFECL